MVPIACATAFTSLSLPRMDSRRGRRGREAAAKDVAKELAKEPAKEPAKGKLKVRAKATKVSAPASRRMVHRRAALDGAAAEHVRAQQHILPRTQR